MPKKQKESKYSIPFIKHDCAIYLKLIVTSKIIFLVDFLSVKLLVFQNVGLCLVISIKTFFFFFAVLTVAMIFFSTFFFFASSVEAGLFQILRCLNTPHFQEGNSFHRKNPFLVLVTVSFDQFSSVQSLCCVQLFATPSITARQASLSITISWSSLKLTSIELVMPSSHLILCRPLFLLPPIPPSNRVFYNESTLCMRWPKYWSLGFKISPSNEHPGLISFRMNLLDLLAVQGNLKSLLQHHSSKTSILRRSAFFTVQLSHSYMTTGKTIALTKQTFFGKVMSLLFNMLSRLVITFLPRSKRLLISWLQSPSAVILEPPKIILTLFPLFPHLFPMK